MDNPYETDRLLSEYLLFHYGRPEEVLPYAFGPRDALGFAERVVSENLAVDELPERARALDLGCAVGRSSFELARHCHEVLGIDFSRSFVRAATTMKDAGHHPYQRTEEGMLATPLLAQVPSGVDRTRARFEVGDACDLRQDLGSFDVVLLANLVDRLPEPARCLARLPALVEPGGQLIIASPFTWLEEYTPREHWLGGTPTRVRGFDTIGEMLAPDFDFVGGKDLPMLIREHARKFQWSVSRVGVWRRKPS